MLRYPLILFATLLLQPLAIADMTIEIQATDFGWYSDSGFHNPNSSNYIAGFDIDGDFEGEFRNFAVFDVSGISGQIVSANLLLLNDSPAGYDSPDATEDYTLFDVASSFSSLIAGTGGVAAFDDLGTGSVYGQTQVSAADNESTVGVQLNSVALAALNNANTLYGIGGRVTSLSVDPNDPQDEQIFARSNLNPGVTLQVKISSVPEVSTIAMFSVVGLGLARRRR